MRACNYTQKTFHWPEPVNVQLGMRFADSNPRKSTWDETTEG